MDYDLDQRFKKTEKSYNGYKKVVLLWESAFIKTTGEKPQKADLHRAPKNVKHSYDKYCKYKKVLESLKKEIQASGKHGKGDASTTPTKIFKGFTKNVQKTPHQEEKVETKEVKSSPGRGFCFGKNLSKKLFLLQPPSHGKKKRGDSRQKLGESNSQSANGTENCLNGTRNESQILSWDATLGVSQIDFDDSSSFEIDTSKIGDDFGIEDANVDIPEKLYTNFLENIPQSANTMGDSIGSLFDKNNSSSVASVSEYTGSSNDGSNLTNNSELNSIAEEVRQCFDILNGTPQTLDQNSVEPYFPFSSFINKGTIIEHSIVTSQDQVSATTSPCSLPGSAPLPTVPVVVSEYSFTEETPAPSPPIRKASPSVRKAPSPNKRKFTHAFSPSPEKQPKKRIFKTDRRRGTSRNISLKSCIPEIPVLPPTRGCKGKTTPQITDQKEKSPQVVDRNPDLDYVPVNSPQNEVKKVTRSRRKGVEPKKVTTSSQPPSVSSNTDEINVTSANVVTDAFEPEMKGGGSFGKKKRQSRKQARPQKNINDNFVAIDVSRKVFVRKKKGMTGAKMKRLDWKKKKSVAVRECKLKSLTCRKCGDIGHFARFCIKGSAQENSVDEPVLVEAMDDSPWPTLEEAARMASSKSAINSQSTRTTVYKKGAENENIGFQDTSDQSLHQTCDSDNSTSITNSQMSLFSQFSLVNPAAKTTEPYFNEDSGIEVEAGNAEDDLQQGLRIFGYTDFRAGQREAILRVLQGKSTLLMLSTGSGKSLCYQLPAYLYAKKYPGTLTICVSPLVSLMEDQVEGLPSFLRGACLHCNMTEKRRKAVIEDVQGKKVQILLVSPEALCGGLFGLFRNSNALPPIAFACIDEVHCVSEWSHNFRPSYLQVCKLLRERLQITTLLGLTATATSQTCVGICEHLQIHPSTVIKGEIIPKNLNLSVSRDIERDVALVRLLNGDRFRDCDSIIIYCTRREECNRISELVRTHVRANPKFNVVSKYRGRGRLSNNCEAYHAGLTAARRATIQKQFMNGTIRIAVATIAFGMGINKSDIRAVIHYNMPSTFESYVQEIGRAGRDGLEANCHLFIDNVKGKDIAELKRHIYANSVDRVTIRKLIRLIFKPCKCKLADKLMSQGLSKHSNEGVTTRCSGHEVSFGVSETVELLDLPEENIETLLCHLVTDSGRKMIEMLPKTYHICKIHSYGGAKLLKSLAQKSPPLAVAIALEKEKKKFKDDDVYLEFNVIEAAAIVGWNSAVVRRELKNLEWIGSEYNAQGKPTKFRKSGLMVEFTELAFRCRAPGDLNDKEYDLVFDSLCSFIGDQERRQLFQLYKVYQSLLSVSTSTVEDAKDAFVEQSSLTLKESINEYFHQDNPGIPPGWKPTQLGQEREEDVRREVQNLILNYKDTKFTGRSIAKIFQGINSPCFPSTDWCRNRAFWRRFLDVDFHLISKIASEEIISYS